MRQRGDLMAEVERQAGGDVNAFVTRALVAATGWEPPGTPRKAAAERNPAGTAPRNRKRPEAASPAPAVFKPAEES